MKTTPITFNEKPAEKIRIKGAPVPPVRPLPVRGAIRTAPMNSRIPMLAGPRNGPPRQWFTVKNEGATAEICLYDEIGEDWMGEGDSAKNFKVELDKIPKDRQILVRINSPGGNVWDGLAIYKLLKERADKVTTQIDGIALSIASVIALGGGKIRMARAGQFMIHDPWSGLYVVGSEEDIDDEARKAINALKAAKESILTIYMDRTGGKKEDLAAAMKSETWYVGEAAKTAGYVDEITDAAPLENSFDLSNFRRVPEALRSLKNSAAQSSGQRSNTMTKDKIIALLKKHGQAVDENATLEQLEAQLDKVLTAKNTAQPSAPAPAPATPPAENAALADVKAQLAEMKAARDAERKARIEREVDNAIEDRRVPAAQRAKWIARAIADESVLGDIKDLPQNLPAEGTSRVIEVNASVEDLNRHAQNLQKEIFALVNDRTAAADERMAKSLKARTAFIRAQRDRLVKIWNEGTNTIDSDLKQDVLLDGALIQFKRILMPLLNFAKNVGSVPLRGTTTIRIPFIPNDTTTATTWNAANGYVAGDTAIEERSLSLTRYYKALRFTADELRRQPYLMLNETFMKASEQLAYDVWLGFLAVITAANYNVTVTGAAASGVATGFPLAAAAFDSNVIANLRNSANLSQWPFVGRILIVNSDYDTALMKDNAIKNAMAAGSNAVIQDGQLSRIFGFNYGMNPNWPTNSENLVGIIAQENAVLIGASPIAPTEAEMRAGLIYKLVSDPDIPIALEYKDFGQPQMNREFRIIEANWAAGKGNEKNLYRLTSA